MHAQGGLLQGGEEVVLLLAWQEQRAGSQQGVKTAELHAAGTERCQVTWNRRADETRRDGQLFMIMAGAAAARLPLSLITALALQQREPSSFTGKGLNNPDLNRARSIAIA